MNASPLNRLNSIDALRGFAALMVVVYHARPEFWVGLSASLNENGLSAHPGVWLGYLTAPFAVGWIGVQIFFVLSGYCIHRRGARMLHEDPQAKLPLGEFFLRRIWRIYPVYFAALLLTALVDSVAWHQFNIEPKAGQDNSMAAFFLSLASLQGFFRPTFGSNTVFWTLSIEMHLYLAYPLMFMISRRWGPMTALMTSLAVSVIYIFIRKWLGLASWFASDLSGGPLFLPYWFTWMVGFYLAEIEFGRARAWRWLKWSWPIILVAGIVLKVKLIGLSAEPVLALGLMGLVAASISPSGARLLSGVSGCSLAWVGVFSYSLYAIHRPMFVTFKAILEDERSALVFVTLAAVFFAVVSGWVFYQLVERWSLRVPTALIKRTPASKNLYENR